MSGNRYLTLCALVLIGAFAGGFAATIAVPVAHAQERRIFPDAPTNVRGSVFTLVDQQGRVQATLRSGATGAELMLDDANGNPRVEIGSTGITIRDGLGRVVWKSPKTGLLPATTE